MQRAASPMDLPDVIAATWNACVRYRRILLSIALAGAVVSAVANFGVIRLAPDVPEGEQITNAQFEGFLRASAPWFAAALVANLFTHLSLVHSGLHLFRGQPSGVGEAFVAGARSLPAAAIAGMIAFLFCLSLLIAVILAPLALYLFVGWMLAPEVIVDERRGPFAALARSRRLVRGQWWRACTVGLAILVLYTFPSIVMAAIGGATNSEFGASLAAGLASLVAAPFLAIGHTQLYLDIRLRKGEPALPASPVERASL